MRLPGSTRGGAPVHRVRGGRGDPLPPAGGAGLANKIRAYALQDAGLDTVQANLALGFHDDERTYEIAADMIRELGIASVALLTNNPRKIQGLREHGIDVVERVPHQAPANEHNAFYLATKRDKSGHLIE